jgi:CPA1 family monovalent cation:H+ antiporter
VGLIDGESLLNDGTALVAYRVAVVAVVSGTFSLAGATGRFFLAVAGGIAIGLAAGYLVRQVRRRLDDPPLELTISLLTGYVAFLPAQALGLSAVLAAVTVGIYMGWHTPELTNSQTRLQGQAIWEIVFFILNATLFMLVGLQLPSIVDALSGYSGAQLSGWAALIAVTVVAVRFAWIFATLVVQGLSLPFVIRVMGVVGGDDGADREDAKARIRAAEAALARLEELVAERDVHPQTAENLRRAYDFRRNRFAERDVHPHTAENLRRAYDFRRNRFRERLDGNADGSIEARSSAYQRLRRELLDAERAAVAALRNDGVINDDVMHRVWRDIDLEAARLDPGAAEGLTQSA